MCCSDSIKGTSQRTKIFPQSNQCFNMGGQFTQIHLNVSLVSSEDVRLPRYCVEQRRVDPVFGKSRAQLAQGPWGVLVHRGLAEDPVPVTWRQTQSQAVSRRQAERTRSIKASKQLPPSVGFQLDVKLPLKKTNFPSFLSYAALMFEGRPFQKWLMGMG